MNWKTEPPTSPGWFWAKMIGTKYTVHGSIRIVEVCWTTRPDGTDSDVLWADGYGDEELCEVAFEWQPVAPAKD